MKLEKHTRRRALKQSGTTLLELIVAVLVWSIVASLALPGLNDLRAASHYETSLGGLTLAIKSTRALALNHNTKAVLCSLDADNKCNGIRSTLAAFLDLNGNNTLDAFEKLEFTHDIEGTVTWRRDARSIKFDYRGWTTAETGTLRVCLTVQAGYTLVISRTGRIRSTRNNQHCPND